MNKSKAELRAELDARTKEAIEAVGALADRIAAKQALIERLAEALEPLGAFTPRCFYDLDDDVIVYSNGGKALTAGDFRAATEVLRVGRGQPETLHAVKAEDPDNG